ncbi:MAG: Fic family protein [Candidatus Aenigmarchaeota archaeon]|nr:Fic family protein [Candidatus Aenigmarchaeota archaeon]
MVIIEKIKRNEKEYYYISKNFRISKNKWKKIRKYAGKEKPGKTEIKEMACQIEKEAEKLGLIKKTGRFRYLEDNEAEVLEDLKESYKKWFGKLPIEIKEKYYDDFLARFTYNTNAIEGNTLGLRDTNLILQDNIIPADATTYEYNEVINSRECMTFIKSHEGELNNSFLLKIHSILTKNTKVKIIGKYRTHEVIITGSEHITPPFKEIDRLMKQFFVWYINNKNNFHPVEIASLIHTKFTRIHPFGDGNGRTARVISNFILLKKGYPMFFIENKDRREYYKVLELSDKGDERPFIKFVFDMIVSQIKIR